MPTSRARSPSGIGRFSSFSTPPACASRRPRGSMWKTSTFPRAWRGSSARDRRSASCRSARRRETHDTLDGAAVEAPPSRSRAARGDLAACPAPHVCDASARSRSRPARDPGALGPRVSLDDAEVHAPRRGALGQGLSPIASQSVIGFFVALALAPPGGAVAQDFPVLKEIDRHVREEFWDPKLKGVDWDGAVQRAAAEVAKAKDAAESDAAYDRLLATLD